MKTLLLTQPLLQPNTPHAATPLRTATYNYQLGTGFDLPVEDGL